MKPKDDDEFTFPFQLKIVSGSKVFEAKERQRYLSKFPSLN